uniref:Uncharacterized protein n=1 Tax=Sphaerodactylus townsendi TaxID=933632 RepID=A0ACB8EBU3_9SAUR
MSLLLNINGRARKPKGLLIQHHRDSMEFTLPATGIKGVHDNLMEQSSLTSNVSGQFEKLFQTQSEVRYSDAASQRKTAA